MFQVGSEHNIVILTSIDPRIRKIGDWIIQFQYVYVRQYLVKSLGGLFDTGA